MALINQYLSYVEQYTSIYGEKTLVLMQVGSFLSVTPLLTRQANIPVAAFKISQILMRWLLVRRMYVSAVKVL